MIDCNFASKRTDAEFFENVTYLSPKDTGLSKGILVDCGENYKYYNHPLCLYIVENEKGVTPVIVSDIPFSNKGRHIPKDIMLFVQKSQDILERLANMEISGGEFFDYIDKYKIK